MARGKGSQKRRSSVTKKDERNADEAEIKSRKKRRSVDGRESDIRFGESEIIAVYNGKKKKRNTRNTKNTDVMPYDFVILSSDVTFGESDTDLINVAWLELKEEGTLLVPENIDEDEIAVGSLICAVTTDVIEWSNGTFQVPDSLHTMVKAKLEKQLADDYDPSKGDDNEPDYETRMRKKRRMKVKQEPKNRESNKKVKFEPDDEMEDLNSTPTKKAKMVKKAKIQLKPRDDIEEAENPWYKATGKIDLFNGDTHRASKEVIRSYLSKDYDVFHKLLKDETSIADFFVVQSCDVPKDIYEYVIMNEDEKVLKVLVQELKAKTPRAPFPVCSLFEASSGRHTSRFADRNRYNVGASRGGKEGNNAFTKDMGHNSYTKGRTVTDFDIVQTLRTHDPISVDFFDKIDKEVCGGDLVRWGFDLHGLICNGHRELAHHTAKVLLERDIGLNQLHVDCLGLGHTLDKFRAVSVAKMTNKHFGTRFCPVHCAATNSNPTYLQQLLEVSPEAINIVDSHEAGLLHYAAVGDTSDTLKWLLQGPGSSLDRNAKMRFGGRKTPLMWAAQTCRADNIRVLCDEGNHAKVNEMLKTMDVNGLTALHHVAKSNRLGRLETAKVMIKYGADPNIQGDTKRLDKQTPLMLSAAKGDLELLKIFIDGGGNPTLVDKLGRTPLMLSAKNGNIHIMSYLLKLGVSVDVEDTSQNTALHYACAYGWVDCVKILIQLGADFNAKNNWSTTPLEVALKKGRFGCAVLLLKQKVDVNVRDKNGVSLFNSLVASHLSQLCKDKEVPLPWAIKQILKREDLDVTTADTSGQTLLHYIASSQGDGKTLIELVNILLKKGVDILAKDKNGQIPVAVALKNENLNLCHHFLKHRSHFDVAKNCDNLIQLLMPNITKTDDRLFIEIFDLLNELNNEWVKDYDDTGMTPLMTAAVSVRSNWSAEKKQGRKALEYLFDKLPEHIGVTRARLSRFRTWKDELMTDGKPNWHSSEEYANGTRIILHELLQCPDLDWTVNMCEKALKYINKSHINLKDNEGKDSLAYALDTFVHKDAPIGPTLKLMKMLVNKGAQINRIMHPLFDTLADAETEKPRVGFNASEKDLEEAFTFVRNKQQANITKLLVDPQKRNSVDVQLFESRLCQIMRRTGTDSPSPDFLHALMKDCGLDPDVKDVYGNTALHKFQDFAYVEKLISFSDVNAVNKQGETPLILSVENENLVKLLIKAGADVDLLTNQGSVLHAAVRKGQNEVVGLLLKTCNVNVVDAEQRTPLHFAVSQGAISLKETLNPIENQLILAGADVNAKDKYSRTPLHYAFFPISVDTKCQFPPAEKRDPIDMVTTLAKKDEINFDAVDEDNRTPLHYAAAVGASICVLLLYEKSKNTLNWKDLDGNTALGLALLANRADTSILLISKGSDMDISVTKITRRRKYNKIEEVSKQISSALERAIQSKSCESVSRYIIAAGKLSKLKVLFALFSTGKFQLAMNQIKMNFSKEALRVQDSENKMTALHRLCLVKTFGDAPEFAPALADALISNGVDISKKCSRGRTALHLASMNGHTELCQHLISKHNASADTKDLAGLTPLELIFDSDQNPVSLSHELLCILADASKDTKAYINVFVKGKFDNAEEDDWKEKENLEIFLLKTPECRQHSKEALIERLKASQKSSKDLAASESKLNSISSTLLIESVKMNNKKLLNILLSYGADGTKVDQNGRTALHHAVLTNNELMLSLILQWNRVPLNAVDTFGFSALGYSVLASLKSSSFEMGDKLLQFGADPLIGNALLSAVKANMQQTVNRMLYCSKNALKKPTSKKRLFKVGDLVWTRYTELSSVWSLAKVTKVGDLCSLIPYSGTSTTRKTKEVINSSVVIEGISDTCICALNEEADIAETKENIIKSLLGEKSTKTAAIMKEYQGCEIELLKNLSHGAMKDSLTSPFAVGDLVGFMSDNLNLSVGLVVDVYKNGQYHVRLLDGRDLEQINRPSLRPLREELQIKSNVVHANLGTDLIHAFLRPVEFGSFEKVDLLRALVNAGAPIDGKNVNGKTPLEEVRLGSEIQEYICEVTKSIKLPVPALLLETFTDTCVESDADLEHQSLLNAESENTERIIPEIIPVCKHELDQDSAENFVLEDGDDFFDVSLSKVDVQQGQYGKYDFYRMQIAQMPLKKIYVLLTNWGRIGEEGKFQKTSFSSKDGCVKEYMKVFKSKTGNAWSERGSFVKQPKKYGLVKKLRNRLKNPEKLLGEALVESHPCTLPKPVADLFRFFLNVKALSSAYNRAKIDDTRLPFGQLTLSTIESAENKLREIKEKIKLEEEARLNGSVTAFRTAIEAVLKVTNEFYELLPIGRDHIVQPFQTYDNRFEEAFNLIRLLRDLTATKQLLLGARYRQKSMNPIDYAYNALRVGIKPLEIGSTERKCLLRYIDNTCDDDGGETVIHQIYTLNDGKEACDISNKRLLFHGSSNDNVIGILKHGLLIAPPEAPHSGFAYGKGVYFSDQFNKALGYTSGLNYDKEQPRSFVFVAEVALGESYMAPEPEYMEKARDGTQSTYAHGGKELDDSFDIVLFNSGEKIPLGQLIERKAKTPLWRWCEQHDYGWDDFLQNEESRKIEDLRRDKNTKFPMKVNITNCDGIECQVTLLGPESKSATMIPLTEVNTAQKESDTEMVDVKENGKEEREKEEDETNIRISTFGDASKLLNKNEKMKTLIRKQSDHDYRGTFPSEFIVYDTKQIRLKYLLEITSKEWITSQFKKEVPALDECDFKDASVSQAFSTSHSSSTVTSNMGKEESASKAALISQEKHNNR